MGLTNLLGKAVFKTYLHFAHKKAKNRAKYPDLEDFFPDDHKVVRKYLDTEVMRVLCEVKQQAVNGDYMWLEGILNSEVKHDCDGYLVINKRTYESIIDKYIKK